MLRHGRIITTLRFVFRHFAFKWTGSSLPFTRLSSAMHCLLVPRINVSIPCSIDASRRAPLTNCGVTCTPLCSRGGHSVLSLFILTYVGWDMITWTSICNRSLPCGWLHVSFCCAPNFLLNWKMFRLRNFYLGDPDIFWAAGQYFSFEIVDPLNTSPGHFDFFKSLVCCSLVRHLTHFIFWR